MKKTGDFLLKSKHGDRPFIADARYQETATKKPVIIFVHGFKGFKDWGHFNLIADFFANEGFVFVKLNLSHNGTTPECPLDFADLKAFSRNTFSIELDDMGIVIDSLINNELPIPSEELNTEAIHLIGHSRGGGLVLLKTCEDDRVTSAAAWAPIHDLRKRWHKEVLDQWKHDGVYTIYNSRTKQNMPLKYSLVEDVFNNSDRLDIPNAVKKINRPMLMIHGTNDETLNYKHTVKLAENNPLVQLKIIKGANHVFGGRHPYDVAELPDHTRQVLGSTLNFLTG